jgi:hypothetical protein
VFDTNRPHRLEQIAAVDRMISVTKQVNIHVLIVVEKLSSCDEALLVFLNKCSIVCQVHAFRCACQDYRGPDSESSDSFLYLLSSLNHNDSNIASWSHDGQVKVLPSMYWKLQGHKRIPTPKQDILTGRRILITYGRGHKYSILPCLVHDRYRLDIEDDFQR